MNGKNEMYMRDMNKDNNKKFLSLKRELTLIQNKEKEVKQQKLIMNRESAKKSRLKKKAYVENLEKEYLVLKTEYIKMIQCQNLKKNLLYNNNSNNGKLQNENLKLGKENVIYEFNTSKDRYTHNNNINEHINMQKKILENLLINQIDLMTPINIKSIQNKFLKLNKLENGDNFPTIKNKINMNLETIKEIYDITENDNALNKKSKGYQLYDFYSNIIKLLDKYEVLNKFFEEEIIN